MEGDDAVGCLDGHPQTIEKLKDQALGAGCRQRMPQTSKRHRNAVFLGAFIEARGQVTRRVSADSHEDKKSIATSSNTENA